MAFVYMGFISGLNRGYIDVSGLVLRAHGSEGVYRGCTGVASGYVTPTSSRPDDSTYPPYNPLPTLQSMGGFPTLRAPFWGSQ